MDGVFKGVCMPLNKVKLKRADPDTYGEYIPHELRRIENVKWEMRKISDNYFLFAGEYNVAQFTDSEAAKYFFESAPQLKEGRNPHERKDRK